MPNEYNKTLKYNHGEKLLKALLMIYADVGYLLEKMHSCQNNLEKFHSEKKNEAYTFWPFIFTNCSFDEAKNKLDCYRRKGCMERFCKDLKEHAMKIIGYEKKWCH